TRAVMSDVGAAVVMDSMVTFILAGVTPNRMASPILPGGIGVVVMAKGCFCDGVFPMRASWFAKRSACWSGVMIGSPTAATAKRGSGWPVLLRSLMVARLGFGVVV